MGSIVGQKAELASPADFKHWAHGVIVGTERLREIANLLGACAIFISETVVATGGTADTVLLAASDACSCLNAAERSGFVADIASEEASNMSSAFAAQRDLDLQRARSFLMQAISDYETLCKRALFVNPGLVGAYPQLA